MANATQRSTNGSALSKEAGGFSLIDWMNILIILTALVGLVGNSAVLWLLGVRLQRSAFSVYVFNLAGADALFLCCSFLLSMHELVSHLKQSSSHELLEYVTYTFYFVGLSILAAISTERCLSVLLPLWYRCHRPKHTSAAVCAVLWALGGLFEVADFVICYPSSTGLGKRNCREYAISEFAWFSLVTCVLCASSLTLLLRVQCGSRRRQPPRLYLFVLLAVLVFLLCGLPMEIEEFINCFDVDFLPEWLRHLLACVNSSANPLMYFFLGRQRHRQKPRRAVLQRALGTEQDLVGGTEEV